MKNEKSQIGTVALLALSIGLSFAVFAAEKAKSATKAEDKAGASAITRRYQRKELNVSSLPKSVKLIEWTKKSKKEKPGRAWVAKFDLTDPKLHFTTRYGSKNEMSKENELATLDEMAASIVAEGRFPLVGVNGNFFTYPKQQGSVVNVYGPIVSDGKVLINGGGNLLVEDEDHVFTLSKVAGVKTAPSGKKVLNATGFYREPTIRYDHGEYHTTDDATYPRTLVGIGEKTLMFLVADGRQNKWSAGVDDRDAVDMLVSEGCQVVAEGDGGGSSSMWVNNLPKKLCPRDQNYINKSSDGKPRTVGEGLFMLYDKAAAKKR